MNKKRKIYGCCGLKCLECPIYVATINGDKKTKKEIAKAWSEEYDRKIEISDIECFGCFSTDKKVIEHCENCQIRACCRSKDYNICAECPDYPCETLMSFLKMIPEAHINLEEMRQKNQE